MPSLTYLSSGKYAIINSSYPVGKYSIMNCTYLAGKYAIVNSSYPVGKYAIMNCTYLAGKYAMTDSAYGDNGSKARMISPMLQPMILRCMEFWYHLAGEDTGVLNVYLRSMGSRDLVWTLSGSQERQWKQGLIDLDNLAPSQVIPLTVLYICTSFVLVQFLLQGDLCSLNYTMTVYCLVKSSFQ